MNEERKKRMQYYVSSIYYTHIKKLIPRLFFNTFFNPLQRYCQVKKINQEKYCLSEKNAFVNAKVGVEYFDFVFNQNNSRDDEYCEYVEHEEINSVVKAIAFYLPQYHAIAENDNWWGKGFTEWTNVSKAIPQFIGHYQPKLPGELGFYDLQDINIQRRQIELAKNYGLHGFCYHYYWFGGKRLLEKPLNNLLDNADLDFPFCVNWANENWSRRWDGLEQELLIKQEHSPEDDVEFIKEVSLMFKDRRYIRVDGKPLLMVYRPSLLPNPKETVERWRIWCRENGIGEIFLVSTHSIDQIDPNECGFDACTEFAPNNFNPKNITTEVEFVNKRYLGGVLDYKSAIERSYHYIKPRYLKFRSVCPGWDNEARKPGRGATFINSSPQKYRQWLEHICHFTDKNFSNEEKLIFINAWNEWAEGAYLEPDRKYGYAFLEETYKALIKFDKSVMQIVNMGQQKLTKKHDTAVILHLFFEDLWEEINDYLSNFDKKIDLYISITGNISNTTIRKILEEYPDAHIYILENKGRDILPFMYIFKRIFDLKYAYICKIHSKKTKQRKDRDIWRNKLFSSLMGSYQQIEKIKSLFDSSEKVGMVLSRESLVKYSDFVGANEKQVKDLFNIAKMPFDSNFSFPAGSMFWFRPESLKWLLEISITTEDFAIEDGQYDGTLAHAIERCFCVFSESDGYVVKTF